MDRVWHPYTTWEDWRAGMWEQPAHPEAEQVQAAAVLGAPAAFLPAARAMVVAWPVAAEHNLTDPAGNRRSWVGQATCCHLAGCRELSTRRAWWTLTADQHARANAVADQVITEWADRRVPEQPALFPIPRQRTHRGPRVPCPRTAAHDEETSRA